MSPPTAEPTSLAWQRTDCLGLAALVALYAAGLLASAAGPRAWMGATIPTDRDKAGSVREVIDPNTASVASLRRVPGIGPERAEAIVGYRQAAARQGEADPRAFESLDDLQRVRGIGPGLVRSYAEHLTVPPGAGADGPASRGSP